MARPLRVLYVVHGFPPETWAGTEVYTLELAREVQRLGHQVAVLARTGVGEGAEFSLARSDFQGLPVWRMLHRLDHQSLRDTYAHPRAEETFREVLDRERPDVVHFQHLLHFSAGLVAIAKERGLAAVATLNDYWALCARVQLIRPDGVRCEENQGLGCLVCVKQKDYARVPLARRLFPLARPLVAVAELAARTPKVPSVKLERIVHKRRVKLARWARGYRDVAARQEYVLGNLSRADLLVAPSRFLRDKFLATGRLDPQKLVYSDYGMPAAQQLAIAKSRDPEGRVRFGFVGTLSWYKGVHVLVDAARELGQRRASLTLFGHFDPANDAYHAELARKAEGRTVRFAGRFDNARLAEVYSEIDVLVVPSIWFENSPLTIHEAFLLRTPVVASGIGGMRELVEDGVNGLWFEAGNSRDLAAVLARLCDEPDLVARLSRRFPHVKSIAENARELEEHYARLAPR